MVMSKMLVSTRVVDMLRGAGVMAVLAFLYQRWRAAKQAKQACLANEAAPRAIAVRKLRVKRDIMIPVMDVKRQAAIARGSAIDHCGCVLEQEDPSFDLDQTIFHTMKSEQFRAVLRKSLSRVPHWSDDVVQVIGKEYHSIPKAPKIGNTITEFMVKECDFKIEHADGSFMDHVSFCHDYTAQNYKAGSPIVLLLHSIMGVGTNLFPMPVEKEPMLAKLVTTEDMKHIEVFPTFIRLLQTGQLLEDLTANRHRLDKLQKVVVHRVIDNKKVEVDTETLWVHLNYNLIHWLDFLPVADWHVRYSESIFQYFLELRDFLSSANQLRAKVDLGTTCGDAVSQEELFDKIRSSPEAQFRRKINADATCKYSQAVHHSLEHKLVFEA